jgi:putative sterol carrier protein
MGAPAPRTPSAPNPAATRALRAFFAWPVRVTRLFGSLPPMSEHERAEARGMTGSVNLDFRDGGGAAYHVELLGDRAAVREGLRDDARTTISVRAGDFVDMLAGRLDPSTAQMTGKVRLRGDGEFVFALGVLVTQFRRARVAKGLRGWPARRYTRYVLRDLT